MAFQVFVSHSSKDRPWVEHIRDELEAVGVSAYLFEHDPRPGSPVTDKIQAAIASSQVLVVLLTENSAPSPFVQQEIGFAVARRKLVIPLVERQAPHDALAMLAGVEYIRFDFNAPQDGLTALTAYLGPLKEKSDRDDLIAMGLMVGLLVLVVWSANSGSA